MNYKAAGVALKGRTNAVCVCGGGGRGAARGAHQNSSKSMLPEWRRAVEGENEARDSRTV